MYSCKKVSHLLSESMDRKLNWKERIGLRFHLMICAVCKRVAKQMEWLKRFSHRASNEAVASVSLSDEARTKMKDIIETEQKRSQGE